jgi:NTP pyrophosphatase (non-canonical NTP hydrolase)
MSDIQKLTKQYLAFRDARNWKQFHNPKDVAMSLMLEAAEVAEHFQWKSEEEIKNYLKKHKGEIADELADVLSWVLLLAHDLKISLPAAVQNKIKKNAKKYPVKKSRDKHLKYNQL